MGLRRSVTPPDDDRSISIYLTSVGVIRLRPSELTAYELVARIFRRAAGGLKPKRPMSGTAVLHLIVGEGLRVCRRRIAHLRLAKLLSTRLGRTNALDLQSVARGI
jgi:hypothetical protein